MCLAEGAATKRGKVEDINMVFCGRKDMRTYFRRGKGR